MLFFKGAFFSEELPSRCSTFRFTRKAPTSLQVLSIHGCRTVLIGKNKGLNPNIVANNMLGAIEAILDK